MYAGGVTWSLASIKGRDAVWFAANSYEPSARMSCGAIEAQAYISNAAAQIKASLRCGKAGRKSGRLSSCKRCRRRATCRAGKLPLRSGFAAL